MIDKDKIGKELNLSVVPQQPTDVDFGWYNEIRDHLLRQTVGKADQVLDVGCGPGGVLLMLSGQIGTGIGIDTSDDDLRRAEHERQRRNVTNVTFRHADATALPFSDERYGVVLLLGDVLTYIEPGRHATVIAGLPRVLEDGGTVDHESMNWDWEYAWPYPPSDVAFKRSNDGGYTMHRLERKASGLETSYDYQVLPATPLHQWISEQEWPVSPQELNTWLEAKEDTPIPEEWLKPCGTSQTRHYSPRDLQQLYEGAGFRDVEVWGYGQTYDLVNKAGLLEQLAPFRSQLAAAEAELALTLCQGCGPWLFLVAAKGDSSRDPSNLQEEK
jgi:ubiquinone/menaquinone biosynthesis C-methylase UbiE